MKRFHRTLITTSSALSLLLSVAGCYRAAGRTLSTKPPSQADRERDNERHIRNLTAGTPLAESVASWESLKAAGVDAFPSLIAHFGDRAIAADAFQNQTAEPTTVGEVCFDLVQQQIEGRWPRADRDFQVLSPGNTRAWLDAHRGLTLEELQRVASRESVEKADAALAADPSRKSLQRTACYLKQRDAKLQNRH